MEKNNKQKNENPISISDFLYVAKKNWLVELILIVVIAIAGFAYAKTFKKNYYVATSSIILKADIGSSNSSYNDTTLAEKYTATVCKLFKEDSVIAKAEKLAAENGYSGVNKGAVKAVSDDETLILQITYQDSTKKGAEEKLSAMISAVRDFCDETVVKIEQATVKDENGNETTTEIIKEEKKYFRANVSIERMGEPTDARVASDRTKTIVIFFGIGVVLAFIYALFNYIIVDKVSSTERLESVSKLNNLITISKQKIKGKNKDLSDATNNVQLDLRKLSDTLIYMNNGDDKKVYQIQSTISAEGKTSVSANLAVALGASQRKTLVIDCDFYKPSIHKKFNIRKNVGITDFFKGEKTFDEIVKPSGKENVDIITCGDRISNHTIFFTSPKFKSIIEQAKKAYDFVILDCSPVKSTSDFINVSPHADATLLVVGCDKVSSRDISSTIKDLDNCGANVVGTVFNFAAQERKNRYYYYSNNAD